MTGSPSLEQRLQNLERDHGKTRETLIDFMSMAVASLLAAAFVDFYKPASGLYTFVLVYIVCYGLTKRLNRWWMRDKTRPFAPSAPVRDMRLGWELVAAASTLLVATSLPVIYLWTIGAAWGDGLPAILLAALPGLGQLYAIWDAWQHTGSPLNAFTMICAGWLAMVAIRAVAMSRSAMVAREGLEPDAHCRPLAKSPPAG